ncbi:MAG: protease pro-enzyme activation domain-containing protein [Actinomycetes bacterium]
MVLRPDHVPVPGSERSAAPSGEPMGAPDATEPLHVTVVLRPADDGLEDVVQSLSREGHREGGHLTRAQVAERFGASPADVELVRRFARDNDLSVSGVRPEARSVELTGTAAAMSAAFGVELALFRTPDGVVRGRTGPVHVPQWLAPAVQAVLGLDTRPQARPHFRAWAGSERPNFIPARAPGTSFTVPQLASLYRFPSTGRGAGQTIAIIELGGGFRQADLDHYFSSLHIDPAPTVTAVGVDGAANQPSGDPTSADGEVVLDIEVAGAVAPGADIVVYFAPNTDQGFLDAVNAAIHDTTHQPSVVSISWGEREAAWTRQSLDAMDTAFKTAVAMGVSVFCAAGDDGSSDGASDGLAHTDFPASSPNVVACGGTRLTASGGTISAEVVWNEGGGATGGGVSDVFDVPAYQSSLHPTSVNPGGRVGRGVPDVAAVADPATGYRVYVDGKDLVFGGTSAVAPLWAGLTALVHEATRSSAAPLQPILYSAPQAFRDITSGNNTTQSPGYSAGPGWDACTGMGTPIGTAVVTAVSGGKASATRGTSPAQADGHGVGSRLDPASEQ